MQISVKTLTDNPAAIDIKSRKSTVRGKEHRRTRRAPGGENPCRHRRKVCAQVKLTNIVFFPGCWGPLPDSTADYTSEHMHASNVREFPSPSTIRKHEKLWEKVELPVAELLHTEAFLTPDGRLSGQGHLPASAPHRQNKKPYLAAEITANCKKKMELSEIWRAQTLTGFKQ